MTRDELVQAAIEALASANLTTHVDVEQDIVDGLLSETVQVVVDTVLAKLGDMAIRMGNVVVEGVTASRYFEE